MFEIKRIAEEVAFRKDLLAEISGKAANFGIDPAILRDWGIYGSQQGIWVDKQRTVLLTGDGNGLAVGLLHKGDTYPDDFDETGVIYHYPVTKRSSSRDLGEVEAVKNCHRLFPRPSVCHHSLGNRFVPAGCILWLRDYVG